MIPPSDIEIQLLEWQKLASELVHDLLLAAAHVDLDHTGDFRSIPKYFELGIRDGVVVEYAIEEMGI